MRNSLIAFIKKPIKWGMNRVIPIFSPVVKFMANTGMGSDACLKRKCLPVPVHFYSPIPDIEELEKRDVWAKVSPLQGINFQIGSQVDFLSELGIMFGDECKWEMIESDENRFCLNNDNFCFGCASSLFSIVRYSKPRTIIEIGSGNSSLVIQEALSKNLAEDQIEGKHIIIDPYPNPKIKKDFLMNKIEIHIKPVECLDVSFFKQLKKNDILFIDSSHSVKLGSDVNFLILDVLPILNPGVIVHFHDINLPFEYPKIYATNPQFRMFWTESYLLQAFLCCNNQYEIMLAMSYLMREHADVFHTYFPNYISEIPPKISGSFWIKKITDVS